MTGIDLFRAVKDGKLFEPTSRSVNPSPATRTYRTTVDFVTTCIITLVLCVWTAVHLNIPSKMERKRFGFVRQGLKRIWWMIVGLLAPEILLWTAFDQFREARALCIELKQIEKERLDSESSRMQGQPPAVPTGTTSPAGTSPAGTSPAGTSPAGTSPAGTPSPAGTTLLAGTAFPKEMNPLVQMTLPTDSGNNSQTQTSSTSNDELFFTKYPKKYLIKPIRKFWEWCIPDDLARGFYIVMGGYEITDANPTDTMQLTPKGALRLAKMGFLPPVTTEDINDKSKADSVSKALVCLQAGWMLVQCIARKIQSLPITLLEINTAMHVVCTLFMYLLWAKKPQNIGIPTFIQDDEAKSLAFLLDIGDLQQESLSISEAGQDQQARLDEWLRKYRQVWYNGHFYRYDGGVRSWEYSHHMIKQLNPEEMHQRLMERGAIRIFFGSDDLNSGVTWTHKTATIKHLKAITELWTTPGHVVQLFGKNLTLSTFYSQGSIYIPSVSNFNIRGRVSEGGSGSVLLLSIFAITVTAVYGGVHLTPWHGHFPTYFERYLWRISGCIIAIAAVPFAVLFAISGSLDMGILKPLRFWKWKLVIPYEVFSDLLDSLHDISRYWRDVFIDLIFITLQPVLILFGMMAILVITLLIITYPLARLYMVAEAFASLRSLPLGTNQTIIWLEVFPHL